MLTHEQSTTLLDMTMDVLEGEVAGTTPQSGKGVIDSWLEQLRQTDNATEIADTLEQVKTQLESNEIRKDELADLLTMLATQTAEFSTFMGSEGDIAPRLEGLSAALKSMAGQLSHT
ncbi:hypothetical protein GCM10028807_01290 [Spirosoma daeguense]